MRPIEQRTDQSFMQALRCVEYRLPREAELKPAGYLLALGLRYGLVGAAASHHLLLSAMDDEEQAILDCIAGFPSLVAEHMRWQVAHRLPFTISEDVPGLVGTYAQMPLQTYLPLYRRLCPLDKALEFAHCDYAECNLPEVRFGWNWLLWGRAVRNFRTVADQSLVYAMNFFERRQADLDEVPEIALLGE